MANVILNIIKVTKNVEEFKRAILTNDGIVDFNLIIPMPKELEIEKSSYGYQSNPERQKQEMQSIENGTASFVSYMRASLQDQIQLMLENFYKEGMSQDKFVEAVLDETVNNPYWEIQNEIAKEHYKDKEVLLEERVTLLALGFYNFQKYGYTDWYDWSIANWGTKENADPDSVAIAEGEGGLVIEFATAWTNPSKIYVELAKRFDFEVVFADLDDKGSYVGTISFKNQEVTLHEFDKDNRLTEDDCYYLASKIEGSDDYEEEAEEPISKDRQEALNGLIEDVIM